jgi:hypothetical protein
MPIEAALFFDNDFGHCYSFSPYCDKITPFHTGGLEHPPPPNHFPVMSWADMEVYCQILSAEGRNYMSYLETSVPAEGDCIDGNSGIILEQAQFIVPALHRKAAMVGVANVAAIFDFDRTLSIFEGFMQATSPPVPPNSGIQGHLTYLTTTFPVVDAMGNPIPLTATGFREYILGGLQRMAMIQALIHEIRMAGFTIVILTNNPIGVTNPEMFREFFPGDEPYINIVCGHPYGGHKPTALQAAHLAFAPLFAGPQLPVADQYIITMDRTPGQNHHVRKDFLNREPQQYQGMNLNELFPLVAPPGGLAGQRSRKRRRSRKQSRRRQRKN